MCLIIDNDVAALVLLTTSHPHYAEILKGLHTPGNHIRLFHGGKNSRELRGNLKLIPLINTLEAAGKAVKFSDADVDAEEIIVSKLSIRSNDPHILALARVSRARVLCTNDTDLKADFKLGFNSQVQQMV